ncbi:MAG: 1-acyl-sn-glycerol-3-phosphate acyltransferase [Lachnospiraceae bacterium]|nr:1-acyl-sn-glycerol-3-phosphate acyltransferase [Lachnospiraceae bacterium]
MNKETTLLFKIIKGFVRLFYGKMEIIGLENLPKNHAIIVGNHTQMNGPIAGELFLPQNCYTWCAGQMMNRKDVPEYAFNDFWSQKPKWTHPFYKILSHLIAPLADHIFNNARTIPVYRDMRIMGTFKETIRMLEEGANILIFPEKDEKNNNILYQFQENFVDVAMLYYKKTGVELTFVPLYIAPSMKKMYIGSGIVFDSQKPIEVEKKRIIDCMSKSITKMARELPEHTVVPYRNIPKKYYLSNKDIDKVPEIVHKVWRKPVVDYRRLRLSDIREPEFCHLLYLLGWIGYFILYFLTENLIPPERCVPVHCKLDDMIPFCELFAIPYVGWYFLIIISLLYFALYNPENFKRLMKFIIVTQVAAMAIYIVFPNRQDMRPDIFVRDNILTGIMKIIYATDTSTNVCPSLHVAYSVGIASTWLKEPAVSKKCKGFITVFCFMVCISVAFVKQHSVVDIFAAIPICILAEWIAFGNDYWKQKVGGTS